MTQNYNILVTTTAPSFYALVRPIILFAKLNKIKFLIQNTFLKLSKKTHKGKLPSFFSRDTVYLFNLVLRSYSKEKKLSISCLISKKETQYYIKYSRLSWKSLQSMGIGFEKVYSESSEAV